MTVKSAQQWSGLIVCKDSTGALSTPTVGPVGTLYVDGTANGASVTISGSNPYKWTVTLPTLTAGQCVSIYITATIATIATASVVAEDVADTKRVSDLVDAAAAPSAADVADAVWDEASTGHVDAGKAGAQLWTDVDAILEDTGTTLPAAIPSAATVADAVWDEASTGHVDAGKAGAQLWTDVDAILADTGTDGVVLADNAITAAKIAADAIGASELAADAVAEIADAVWDEVLSGHSTTGTTGYQLSRVDTLGAGAITFTYTLTSSVDAAPIADADVWATSDLAGASLLASGRTNASGVVTFYLDAGTVYVWRQKSGWNFTNPDTEVVA